MNISIEDYQDLANLLQDARNKMNEYIDKNVG